MFRCSTKYDRKGTVLQLWMGWAAKGGQWIAKFFFHHFEHNQTALLHARFPLALVKASAM
jgi:hypothetical protein